jgi:xanthine/uracil permease
MGTTAMTRVASRKPFILGSAFMIVLGVIGPVGTFFASIPPSVGYSAMMIIFSMILGQGLREFAKSPLGPRESMVIGISMILGIGIMFLPSSVFLSMPQGLRYIVSNGLVDGIIVAILLEHVLLREGKARG